MFVQNLITKPIRDFVFPVCTVKGSALDELIGTAFFIGSAGVALTAAHVIEQAGDRQMSGLFANDDGSWWATPVVAKEIHDKQDVGAIRIDGQARSIFTVSGNSEPASLEYDMWAYPEKTAEEMLFFYPPDDPNLGLLRPDLIYTRGYVRRRVSRELNVSVYRGDAFYELSVAGGACCSGSPLVKRAPGLAHGTVFGVYIGEETAGTGAVGFGVRSDAFASWSPAMLKGSTVAEQIATV